MNGFTTFAITLVAVTTLFSVAGAEEKEEKIMCDGHEMKNMAEMYTAEGMNECLDKYAPPKDLPADASEEDKLKAYMARFQAAHNMTCYLVCTMKIQKSLDANGAFVQTGSDALIDKIYPTTDLADQMKKARTKCAEGQTFSMDNECESYKGFLECSVKAHMTVCKVDPKEMMKTQVQ